MSVSFRIAPARSASDLRAAAEVTSRSYKGKLPGFLKYLREIGRDNVLLVRDASIPANAGRWTALVENGRARVARGGPGRVRLDIRGLAAALTGYMAPVDLALAGLVEGPEAHLEALAAMFAGPTPYTTDGF